MDIIFSKNEHAQYVLINCIDKRGKTIIDEFNVGDFIYPARVVNGTIEGVSPEQERHANKILCVKEPFDIKFYQHGDELHYARVYFGDEKPNITLYGASMQMENTKVGMEPEDAPREL